MSARVARLIRLGILEARANHGLSNAHRLTARAYFRESAALIARQSSQSSGSVLSTNRGSASISRAAFTSEK